MKRLFFLIILLALTGTACATAVPVYLVGFQSGGWQLGYPYYATANGSSVIDVMCDDWVHGGSPGDSWYASFTNLGTGNLSMLRYRQLPGALVLYKEAGWLILQTKVTPPSQWMDINYAVWHIFAPNAPLPGTNPLYWLNLAQQEAAIGFPGVDFDQIGIYTPINPFDPDPNGPQELLTILPSGPFAPVVPEPGTILLMGSGLAGLLARMRLRRLAS